MSEEKQIIELENNVKMEVMNIDTFEETEDNQEELVKFIDGQGVLDIEDEIIMDDMKIGDTIDIVSKNGDTYYKGTFKRVE